MGPEFIINGAFRYKCLKKQYYAISVIRGVRYLSIFGLDETVGAVLTLVNNICFLCFRIAEYEEIVS